MNTEAFPLSRSLVSVNFVYEHMEKYTTLEIIQKIPNSSVYHLHLNKNPSLNHALSRDFFTEFPRALSYLDQNPDVSVIILSGHGNHFCSGIDVQTLNTLTATNSNDQGRARERLRRVIKLLQDSITAIEQCRKPVIAAIHGACIGAGVDIVTACDIRYCSEDAFFSVKEVNLGLTADLGTLQRLPGIVGYGNAVELALTGQRFSGLDAKTLGLVSRVFSDKNALDKEVRDIAEGIAAKSPLAVTGTKAVLLRSRDMTTDQGLDYVATWNSAVLISDDLKEAVSAFVQKRKPVFARL